MKKTISFLTTLAICLSLFAFTGIYKINADVIELQIRPLVTFDEELATLQGYLDGVLSGSLANDGTYTSPLASSATGIITNGKSYSGKSMKIQFSAAGYFQHYPFKGISNKPLLNDWTGGQYIQFWVKNISNTAININPYIKQNSTAYIYNANSPFHLLKKGSITWTSATTNDSGSQIPAKFDGFIRFNLDPNNFSVPSWTVPGPAHPDYSIPVNSLHLWITNYAPQTIYIDDYSLVGENLSSETSCKETTVSESSYFANFTDDSTNPEVTPSPGVNNVRTIMTFDESIDKLQGYLDGLSSGELSSDGIYSSPLVALCSGNISNEKSYLGNSMKFQFSGAGYFQYYSFKGVTDNIRLNDWNGAQFLQFWIENTSNASINITPYIGQNGPVYIYSQNSPVQFLGKGDEVWLDSVTSESGIQVPAKFEGFLRVELNPVYYSRAAWSQAGPAYPTFSSVVTSLHLWITSFESQTAYIDDFALVGNNLSTNTECSQYTVSENTYFESFIPSDGGGGQTGGIENIKMLTSFEVNDDSALIPVSGINWVPYEYSISDKYKYSGNFSYCAKVGKGLAGMEPYSLLEFDFPENSDLANWNNAEYLFLWVKNVSNSPVGIGNFLITDTTGGTLQIKAGTENVCLLQNGVFTRTEIMLDNATSLDIIELPPNYEGFIRLKLTDTNDTLDLSENDVMSAKFFVVNSELDSALYFDDLAIGGKGLDGAVTESATYFGDYKGGIVNNFKEPDVIPETGDTINFAYILLLAISLTLIITNFRKSSVLYNLHINLNRKG